MDYHFAPATLARDIQRLADDLIFPPSNHILAEQIQRLYIHQTIAGAAKRYEKAADEIKEAFAHRLAEVMPETPLLVTSGVTLKAKVSSGREAFDKDAFIKVISEKFELSAAELHKIAMTTVKKSKPPVSLITSYQGTEL